MPRLGFNTYWVSLPSGLLTAPQRGSLASTIPNQCWATPLGHYQTVIREGQLTNNTRHTPMAPGQYRSHRATPVNTSNNAVGNKTYQYRVIN
jgi:hypothetical protein